MTDLKLGYEKTLGTTSLDDARTQVVAALATEGFGVLTEIDVRATLKKKLDVDFRPYVILGACNPGLAHRSLTAEPRVGLLLPCNVVLQAGKGGIELSIANPRALAVMVQNPELEPIMQEAEARLQRVMAAVA